MWSNAQLWVTLAYVCIGLMMLWQWSAILFTALYQYVLYPRRIKRRYDPDYLPSCTIIVPCKGTPPQARGNLRAFLQQEYPSYDVIFAVEAEDDPAVPVIRDLIAEHDRASLVVAGLTSTCAQKVYNQLAAIERLGAPEVLVFADNDIAPASGWLRDLVLPLSDSSVFITTGFRWLLWERFTLGELVHVYTSLFIYPMFTWLAYWNSMGLWGGTMAMRKRDFDELQVASTWRECVVDDMSLSQIIMRRKLRPVLVPLCVAPSVSGLSTFDAASDWVARQILYIKAYHVKLWWLGVVIAPIVTLIYALLPISAIGALLTPMSFWDWGGGVPLAFFGGEMVSALLYATLGPLPRLLVFSLLAPVLRFGHIVGFYKTVGTRTITWSGVRYTFDGSGKVVRVER